MGTRELVLRSEFGIPPERLHAFAMRHALTIPSGIIYSYIPKNACTSLRFAAGIANGFKADPIALQNIQACIQASLAEVRNAEYTFVVLRCPYRRLASMFLDKALNESWRFNLLRPRFIRRLPARIDHLTFRSFVQKLEKRGALMIEHHWAPQSVFLVYSKYDDYFSVERADQAFALLRKRFPIEDTRDHTRHSTIGLEKVEGNFSNTTVQELRRLRDAGKAPAYEGMYDSATRKVFDRLFRIDIDLYKDKIGDPLF